MQPEAEASRSYDQMALIEKYERVINYLYPIAQSMPRKHGVMRDMFLACLLGLPREAYKAGKTNQVSRVYEVDASLAELRFWMRRLFDVKCITLRQVQAAQSLIAEVGAMVGAWIKRKRSQG
jgi:hypothetical protein